MKYSRGFTLIELVAIIVVIGTLSASLATRLMPTATHQLQAARDLVLTSLFTAQQKAMTQLNPVVVEMSGSIVDLKIDGSSVISSGTTYPFTLPSGVTLSTASIAYDRLGHTSSTSITLSKGAKTVAVSISGTGYAY